MAFIPAYGCAKVAIRYVLFDQEVINTLWFASGTGDPWSGGSLSNLCNWVWDWSTNELLPLLSNDLKLTLVEATDQSIAESSYGSFADATEDGDIVSQSLPSGSCITIKFGTYYTGRSNRGRNYISGIPAVSVADNRVESTFATNLAAAYETLNSYVAPEECSHVVVSKFTNNAPRETATFNIVQNYVVVDRNIDSQRRRLTGRGN